MLQGLARPDGRGKKSLRLSAWQWLASGAAGKIKPLDCDRDCGRKGENTARREVRGCTRADLPPVSWANMDPEDATSFYFGREPDDDTPGFGTPEKPTELACEGCPAGYARAPFVASLTRFYRRPTDDGDRVANPRLDRCHDDLVLDAIAYLEGEEARADAERQRQWAAKQEADRGT